MPGTPRDNPPPPPRLCGYLDGLVAELLRLTPLAVLPGEVDAVHDTRVATRRVQSAIKLFSSHLPTGPRRRFVRGLRKLRRKLRRLRDLDVMIEHLQQDEPARSPAHAPAATWLLERLRQCRQDKEQRLAGCPSAARALLAPLDAWPRLRNKIPTRPQVIEQCLTDAARDHAHRFIHAADALVSAAGMPPRAAQAGAGNTPNGDNPPAATNPHLLRIDGKRLRYTLELLQVHRASFPKQTLRSFKRMQEMLGLWHDHIVLSNAAIAASLDESLAYHAPQRYRQVLSLAQAMLDTADAHWKDFRKLWMRQGAGLAQSLNQLLPVPARSDTGRPPASSSSDIATRRSRGHGRARRQRPPAAPLIGP